MGSVVAGVTADRGRCGACDRVYGSLELGNRELVTGNDRAEQKTHRRKLSVGRLANGIVQRATKERNLPHGWAVYMFNGRGASDERL